MNCGSQGSWCRFAQLHNSGVQSCHDLLKLELLAIVQCTVNADVGVVLWNSTFLHFIQHVLFDSSLLQCVYVYVCISVSLSFISLSLWKALSVFLPVLFSFNISFDSSFLLKPFRSDQISHSVMSDSLRPHESQRARPPCPSPTPGVHSDSRPLSQ